MLYRHETKSGRRQVLSGTEYQRGESVPDDILATIPPNRVASMKRVGLLLEAVIPVASDDMVSEGGPVVEPVALVEGLCPECGEGPFTRLARHISAKHESVAELQESVNGA